MKNKIFILSFILLTSFSSYILSKNWIFTFTITITYLITISLIYTLYSKKKRDTNKSSLNNFINEFLISYEEINDIDLTINKIKDKLDKDLKEELFTLSEYIGIDKLEKLTEYFNSPLYLIFLKKIKNNKSDNLFSFVYIENIKHIKENKDKSIIKNKYFIILISIILFSYLILIIFKYSINTLFFNSSYQILYFFILSLFYLFTLLSIIFFINEEIKE